MKEQCTGSLGKNEVSVLTLLLKMCVIVGSLIQFHFFIEYQHLLSTF